MLFILEFFKISKRYFFKLHFPFLDSRKRKAGYFAENIAFDEHGLQGR